LISNFNSIVESGDITVHGGDFALDPNKERVQSIID